MPRRATAPFLCYLIWTGLTLAIKSSELETCGEHEFQCRDGGCISIEERCNGINNCKDSSDEKYCAVECIEPMYFKCDNDHCVASSFVCDGDNQCGDNSDERNCLKTVDQAQCSDDEFHCLDNLCIPENWVCDGKRDCLDSSDEIIGCTRNVSCSDGYRCRSNECIATEWRCDGHKDCSDGTDEENCDDFEVHPNDCKKENNKFLCKDNKKCLQLFKVCDKKMDCADGSDEGGECSNEDLCKKSNCKHSCQILPTGPLCVCPDGLQATASGACEDINECLIFGSCDQYCNNTIGSYQCHCASGYVLQDDMKTCKAKGGEALLLFSSFNKVHGYFLNSGVYYPVAQKLSHVTGITYDGIYIYWSSVEASRPSITKSNENGSKKELIITAGLGSPKELAIDWITQNLYFTDSAYKLIGVCTNDGIFCTVIHNTNIDKPQAIALQPENGLMFWSDWGSRPLIARSGMDGSYYIDFVTENVHWPNGITIDHGNSRLYWVDAKFQVIECIKLDRTDRRKVSTSVTHPYSIAVFENMMYWSDWKGNEIKACNKFTGKDCKTIVKEKKENIHSIHVYHPSMEEEGISNPCAKAKCSEICLLSPKNDSLDPGYSCACSEDKTLSSNKQACHLKEKQEFLVVGYGHKLLKLEHKKLGKVLATEIPVHSVDKVGALAYDSVSGRIMISDWHGHKIVAFDWNAKQLSVLVNSHVGKIVGMDFDYYGNNLYWVDEEKQTVEVLSLSTMSRTVLIKDLGGDTPCDIAIIPNEGVMYIALHNGLTVHIDRLTMDGSVQSRKHVIEDGLMGPKVALAYDSNLQRVYWADSGTGHITSTDHEGVERHTYRELTTSPVDIAFLQRDIFWLNYGSNVINWVDKYNGDQQNKQFALAQAEGFENLKLIAVTGLVAGQSHVCQISNGGCSHLCLLADKVKVCACPEGMELEANKVTCRNIITCKPKEFKCSTGECIPKSFRCNKKMDCPNNDDEWDCKQSEKACPPFSFACHNGKQCIDDHKKCDFVFDCDDNSDELDCSAVEPCTGEASFLCGSGECISAAWRCDEKKDCGDESDEDDCKSTKCNANKEFRCDSGNCIPKSWECDMSVDCPDASDEHDRCASKHKCDPHSFTCSNKNCIDHKMVCNGMDDCEDNSDEKNCLTTSVSVPEITETFPEQSIVCTEMQIFCPDQSICLPIAAKCNGTSECLNGEDEINCMTCQDDEFECSTEHICIPKKWVCDKSYDCIDKSDEDPAHCSHLTGRTNSHMDEKCTGYHCKDNYKCIPFSKICDKNLDCEDGSDEGGLCGKGCNHAGCSDICTETPTGPLCSCERGFYLKGDAKSCIDLNECDFKYSCSHYCKNTQGSYKCSCVSPDYQLREDRKRCKAKGPEMEYIFIIQGEIRFKSASLSRTGIIYKANYEIHIDGLDLDMKRREIFWTSEKLGTLTKMSLDIPEKYEKITSIIKPTKVAYDWLTGNIYLVEKGFVIRVCHIQQKKCAKVYTGSDDITIDALGLDPISGWMFWSETSWHNFKDSKSSLKRAEMSGANEATIIDHSLNKITDISVDTIHHLIYWSDHSTKRIERSDYNGSYRELIFETKNSPIDVTLFEDYVYWTNKKSIYANDQQMGYVGRCGLYGSAHLNCDYVRLSPHNSYSSIERLRILQPAIQIDANNVCDGINCSHMCVKSVVGYTCLCEDGVKHRLGQKCNFIDHSDKTDKLNKLMSEGLQDIQSQKGGKLHLPVSVVSCVLFFWNMFRRLDAIFLHSRSGGRWRPSAETCSKRTRRRRRRKPETYRPNFVSKSLNERNESKWGWWVFLCIFIFGSGGCLTYFGLNYFRLINKEKIDFTRIHFQNPTFEMGNPSHQASPFHHSFLTPGQHQYENPTVKDQGANGNPEKIKKEMNGDIKSEEWWIANSDGNSTDSENT